VRGVDAGCEIGIDKESCRLQEVGILKGLNYDRNIVQFYGACIREACDPLLITEYMEGAPANRLQ
jgi:hypothetical protein